MPDGLGVGDRHLWALLRVDGTVMSGGVGFAAEVIGSEDFTAAIEASRYFGLPHLAEMLEAIAASEAEDDDELQNRYDTIEDDQLITRAFRQKLQAFPGDFARLDDLEA